MNWESQFWDRVEKTPTCWNWTGAKDRRGYGRFHPKHNVKYLAHRYSYELLKGPIPEDRVLDHLCRNHSCVNPTHIEAVSQRVNLMRGKDMVWEQHRAKEFCPKGHPYSGDNLYINPSNGGRNCRICQGEAWHRWKVRQS